MHALISLFVARVETVNRPANDQMESKMSKLYDLYLDNNDDWTFQMRASLPVIVQVLKLGDAALKRIEYETDDGVPCDVHKNGHTWYVKPALVPLGLYGEPHR